MTDKEKCIGALAAFLEAGINRTAFNHLCAWHNNKPACKDTENLKERRRKIYTDIDTHCSSETIKTFLKHLGAVQM